MAFRLIPRDEGFYGLFNDAAANAAVTARALREVLASLPTTGTATDAVVTAERRGDEINRDVIARLDRAIITPFDREDILLLIDKLDDAVDDMRSASDLTLLHVVDQPIDGVAAIADLLVEASDECVALIAKLPKLRDLTGHIDRLHALESKGDELNRQTNAALFSGRYDTFTVLKWVAIVEALEKALNRFERTADIVATIALKHA